MVQIGITHVGGHYTPDPVTPTSGVSLLSGASEIVQLSSSIIKVYLSPSYETDYSQDTFVGSINNLTDLASTDQYATLFASGALDTYFVSTFTFANGINNPWQTGISPTMLENEKNEIKDLTVHLLTTYANTGKTFILQNWEGDWALFGETDANVRTPVRRADWMAAFLRARQRGVNEARQSIGMTNVKVLNAVEVNRVVDAINNSDKYRVVRDVLPKIKVDFISWSAYDGTTLDYGSSETNMLEIIDDLMTRSVATIRRYNPGTPIYLGEFGFAENELPGGYDVANLVNKVHSMAVALDIKYILYWQVYDNECTGPDPGQSCRGFWMIEPDGTVSGAGAAIVNLIVSSS